MATSIAVALIYSRLEYASSLLLCYFSFEYQLLQNIAARLILQQSFTSVQWISLTGSHPRPDRFRNRYSDLRSLLAIRHTWINLSMPTFSLLLRTSKAEQNTDMTCHTHTHKRYTAEIILTVPDANLTIGHRSARAVIDCAYAAPSDRYVLVLKIVWPIQRIITCCFIDIWHLVVCTADPLTTTVTTTSTTTTTTTSESTTTVSELTSHSTVDTSSTHADKGVLTCILPCVASQESQSFCGVEGWAVYFNP